MRITKRLHIQLSFCTLIAVMTMSTIISPLVSADQVNGRSYFEDADVGLGNLISPNHLGYNSIYGSVMPNRDMSTQITKTAAGVDTGSGAVGTKALGIYGTSADNRTRKQALYCFLQNKYGLSSDDRHASCTGTWPATIDWERMGAALIAHQMLGKDWGEGSRTVTGDEWTDLYEWLVLNEAVSMDRVDYNYNDNTAGVIVGGEYDAVRWEYFDGDEKDAWLFREGSEQLYALEIICANPLGNLGGLDEYTSSEYELNPTASIDKTVVEPDDSVSVTNTVTNTGVDPSNATLWQLTRMVYGPGTTLSVADKEGRDSADGPCGSGSFISSGRSACDMVQELTDAVFSPGVPRTFDPVYQYDVPVDTPVGTKICFTTSVSRPTEEASPVWRHSTLQCVTVGKKPKLQVWGGDVRTGGKIETSISTITSLAMTHGSWGEYGALSRESNSGFASGSGLNNGSGNPSQSTWSNLTFANTGGSSGCSFGCYNFSLSSGGLVSQFASQASTPAVSGTVNLNDFASGTYRADNVTLSGTTIGAGKTIVLVASGTVTIDGTIAYEDISYTNIYSIPQVIIRAPLINIRGGATQVDAWLLATSGAGTGVLNTCSDVGVTVNLTADICNNRLVINGPVVADTVYLRRTAGSDSQPAERGTPAETFNLRADAYLWANAYGSGSSRVQTVYTKELSPRF